MENELIIDGANATMGRLASYAAKQSLMGKKIIIVNADEVVIIGNRKDISEKYKRKFAMGGAGLKGPKIHRSPEKILKRSIRGMLSHKEGRGREAIQRVMCYNQTPDKYKDVKKIHAGKEKKGKFITLNELVKMIK
jgi:large subunit ribosomal protein L13